MVAIDIKKIDELEEEKEGEERSRIECRKHFGR